MLYMKQYVFNDTLYLVLSVFRNCVMLKLGNDKENTRPDKYQQHIFDNADEQFSSVTYKTNLVCGML